MRVKIQRGSSSIEVEGEYVEVEKVLSAFWAPASQSDVEVGHEDLPQRDEESSPALKAPKRLRKPTRRPPGAPRPANDFDVDGAVNQIRNDARWAAFQRRVVMVEGDRPNKVRFVSWFLHELPLTSGNVHRVLVALGIKIDLSTVSKAMTGNCKNDYLKDMSGPQPTYRLSAPAHAKFEEWLLNDHSEAA